MDYNIFIRHWTFLGNGIFTWTNTLEHTHALRGKQQKFKLVQTRKYTSLKTHSMLKNTLPILLSGIFHCNIMKQLSQHMSLNFIRMCSKQNAYTYVVFFRYILWKRKSYIKGEQNNNVRDIALFGW